MFSRFNPERPDLFELSGKKVIRLFGSVLVTTSVLSAAGIALAADKGDDEPPLTIQQPIVEQPQTTSENGGHRKSLSDDDFDDFNSDPNKNKQNSKKSDQTTGSNGDGKHSGAVLGVGSSEMMPTEFVIESDDYGSGQYRRYSGQYVDQDGTKKPSGKLVQEILVSRDDADAMADLPKLAMPEDFIPRGLQVTGFVAVKMWLSTVLSTHNGCLIKPKVTNGTLDWKRPAFEHESNRKNCALSFRLTLDLNASGTVAEHGSMVFLKGELCRYPEGNTEFNAEIDDAECVEVSTIPVSKKKRLFLSDKDEWHRAIKSTILAEKIINKTVGDSAREFVGYASGAEKHTSLGNVSDMFSMFIRELSMLSATAYNWQLAPVYLGGVQETSYKEKLRVKDVRYSEAALKKFLEKYTEKGETYTEKSGDNPKSAGIESTVSEMLSQDEETEELKVAYLFRIEANKGMAFVHEESGEEILLLDNSKMSPLGKKSVQLRKVQAKLDRCQIDRINAEDKCAQLEETIAGLNKQLEGVQGALDETTAQLDKKTKDHKDEMNLLKEQQDLTRSVEEMEVVSQERKTHQTEIADLNEKHRLEIEKLKRAHDLEVREAKARKIERIYTLEQQAISLEQELRKTQSQLSKKEKSERDLSAEVTRLEKDLKGANEDFDDRVTTSQSILNQQVAELNKKLAAANRELDSKNSLLAGADKDKKMAIKEMQLKFQGNLNDLKQAQMKDSAKLVGAFAEYYAARGFGSDLVDPSRFVMPSFDIVNDNDGTPKASPIRFSKSY